MNAWQDLMGKITCSDCLDILKQLPDKCVDLLLTDPPYWIDYGGQLAKNFTDQKKGEVNPKNGYKNYGVNEWDKERPSAEIFREMLRVSKNQIIWGGNYFADLLPATQGWLVWNKMQRGFTLADGELAWTSFDKALRIFDYSRGAALQDGKIHPTQKPLRLFEWCLNIRSKENDIVLDCFSGSGTTAVACHNLHRRFICIERDPEYAKASQERLAQAQRQQTLF